jgi:hypothetical protein
VGLIWPYVGPTANRPTTPEHDMTRRQQLFALAAQLHELTTEEEREDYPFWDHLNDLINDMEIEED